MEYTKHTGIGLVAIGPREIQSGDQYEHLFKKPDFKDTLKVPSGSIDQIVREMGKVIRKNKADTALLAPMLQGQNLEETCANIWEFMYNHIQYRKDKQGEEQLRTPARLWAERGLGGDCDCGTIFICTILLNLGIEPTIRITGYDGRDFQHVYPIVMIPGTLQYYVIDFVVGEFNYEKEFTKKRDYSMKELGIPIHVLSGIDDIAIPEYATENENNTYQYLLNYRKMIIENPVLAQSSTGNALAFIKMLDYAIQNFWKGDDIRNKAFEALSKEEKRLNLQPVGLSGLDGGFAGFWDSVTSAFKTGATAVNKVNPVAVAAKAAFRQLVLMNYQGLATRLAYGRLSLFDTKNYPKEKLRPALREIYTEKEIDEYFNYVDRVKKALDIYRNAFGGTGNEWDMLKSTIKKAAIHKAVGFPERVEEARKLRQHVEKIMAIYKKHFNREFLGEIDFSGESLGEPASAAATATAATAAPILTQIGVALGGSIGTALIGKAFGGDTQKAVDDYTRWKNGEITDEEYQKAISFATDKAISALKPSSSPTSAKSTVPFSQGSMQYANPSTNEPSFFDSIKNAIFSNPVPTAIAAIGLGYLIFPQLFHPKK